jgi:copper(I)-binding protein
MLKGQRDHHMRMQLLAGMAIALSMSANAMATDYKAGPIEIMNPWSRATPKGAKNAVGYMTIKNNGTTADRLIGGSIDVAETFQLHSMVMENGIAKMHELPNIEIKPGQIVEFKPGSSHTMFVNLKHPLTKGDRVNGTLVFEHAGNVQIEYSVQGIGAQSASQGTDHMHH